MGKHTRGGDAKKSKSVLASTKSPPRKKVEQKKGAVPADEAHSSSEKKAPAQASGSVQADGALNASVESVLAFYLDDLPKTLFPLETNRVLVEYGEVDIQSYIARCLDENEKAYGFAPQKRVFISKPHGYLRRTMKFDVVAEYYLYDVVFRNRQRFRKPHVQHRSHYGYRFENGLPIAATQAYRAFKGGLAAYSAKYAHSRSMDVATYFNSLYHHDIVSWFHDRNVPAEDAEGLG